MNYVVYFTSFFIIISCKIYIVSSVQCTHITETSGIITNEKRAASYSKCWTFSVPQHSRAVISMESFSADGKCSKTDVEISLNNGNENHKFCPDSHWEPLILNNDFTVTHGIHNFWSSTTSKITLHYKIESLLCPEEDTFKCSDGTCLLQSQVCDGTKHCSDGVDEEECETKVISVEELKTNRFRGIRWMKKTWSSASDWQENTHRGITALFLGRGNVENLTTEEKLMVKQLEVQTLVYLLRNETDPMTVNQLSMFVNALTVSCLNPRNFYGYDLVKLLKDKVELSSTINRPVAYLALCNADETLPINATKDLKSILNTNVDYPFFLDVQAVAVMALSCLQASYQKTSNDSFPQTDYEEAVRKFKELQLEDGSFGNIYTTAVVTQALISVYKQNSKNWNYNKAINHLIQYLNSSSVDFLAAYLILPILNGKCLSDIRNTTCSIIKQKGSGSDAKAKLGPKMRIQYSLYVGDEKDVVHTISLRVPENTTVYKVMQLAQDADPKYKFRAKKMGEKLYIYDIAGIANDFEDNKFWLLYVGKDSESTRQVTESSDEVTLQDGGYVVIWYKKAQI